MAPSIRRIPQNIRGGLPSKQLHPIVGHKLAVDFVQALREERHFQGAQYLPREMDQPPKPSPREVEVEH